MTHIPFRTAAVTATALLTTLLAVPAPAAPTWLAPASLSAGNIDAYWHDVAVDSDGDAIAAWSTDHAVQAAWRTAGGQWEAPVDLSDPTQYGQDTLAAFDAAGNATVVWRQLVGPGHQEIQARSRSASGAWGAVASLSTGGTPVFKPSLAVDADGSATVAWYEQVPMTTNYIVKTARRPAGGNWEVAASQSGAGPIFDPRVAANVGVVALAWRDRTTSKSVIWARVRSPAGVWSAATPLSPAALNSTDPQVLVDDSGVVTVAWQVDDGTHTIVHAITRSTAGVWSGVQEVSDGSVDSVSPALGVATNGAVTATWYTGGTHSVIQVASHPQGGSWSDPQPLSDPLLDAGPSTIAIDQAGNTVVSWASRVPSSSDESVLASRRPAGGSFGAPVVLSPPALADQTTPEVSIDGAGNAVAVFQRWNGSHQEIQAAALDAAPPVVSAFTVPSAGKSGKPLSFSASATDTWSAVSYAWSFGDGGTASGPNVSHKYADSGTYTVSLTATDAAGNATTRTAMTAVKAPVPAIGKFKLTKPKIHGFGRALPAKTKLKVTLNTAATLKVVFKSKHKHLVKGKTKYVRVVLKKKLPAGLSKITIKAKVKGKLLKPDTYVLTGTAKNSSGKSPKKKVQLKVVR